MKRHLLAAALTFLAGRAFAQECTALAGVIGRQTSRVATQDQVLIARRAQLCSSRYESATSEQKAQIDASYGLFSGGASGSDQQIRTLQTNECSDRYGTYWHDQVSNTQINDVSFVGAEVVKACLAQQSFRLVGLTLEGNGISAVYRFNGAGSTKLNGVFSTPENIVTGCSVSIGGEAYSDLTKIRGLAVASGSTLTLTCTRAGKQASPLDPSVFYEGGVITVATESDSPRLPLISYTVPAIPANIVDALRGEIAELRQRPAFAFTGTGVSAPTASNIDVALANSVLSRGVSSINSNGRFVTIQKSGYYELLVSTVQSYNIYTESTVHAYKSCAVKVRRAAGPTEYPLSNSAFDSNCHSSGVVLLNAGDQISVWYGNSGEPRAIDASFSGHYLGPQ